MNLPNLASPRFGASINTVYGYDIPNSMLDVAKELNNAKAKVQERVKDIQDKKDPVRIQVSIEQDKYSASYTTNNNGQKQFKPEANETPVSFLQRVVSAVETLAPTLVTLEERNANNIRTADAFLTTVLRALMNKQVENLGSRDTTGGSARMHGTTERSASIRVNGQTYQLHRAQRGTQMDYTITLPSSDASNPNDSTRFNVSWIPNQGFRRIFMEAPGKYADFTELRTHQDAVIKLGQRAQQLFQELEKQGAFTAADFEPIV